MAVTASIVRGQPPTPPQSTDGGEPGSEAHLEPCDMSRPLQNTGMHTDDIPKDLAYDGSGLASLKYSCPPPYYVPDSNYPSMLPSQHPMIPKALQVNTPPAGDDGVMTSEAESTPPPMWPSPDARSDKPRVSRPPRQRRPPKKSTPDLVSNPDDALTAPLSELTKHMTHVHVKDMDVYAHRSADDRRKEALKKGKVSRPMNSFMLYRSAYADRAKEWFGQTNHQVVSRAAGASWKIESPEIRDKYETLAVIEKTNHGNAHPDYKFSPKKDQVKRKRPSDEEGSTDADDPDFHLGPNPYNMSKRARSSEVDSCHDSRGSTPFDYPDSMLPPGGYHHSSWHMSNPGRPAPGMVPAAEQAGYMQSSIHSSGLPHVDDVRYRIQRVALQDMYDQSSSALAGLPGGAHHDLLQPHSGVPTPDHSEESQLDPQLLTYENGGATGGNPDYSGSHYALWQEEPAANSYIPAVTSNMHYHHLFQPGHEAWELGHEANITDAGREFDHWFDSQ